ncbi:MAG: oxidoreductase [Parcubacteria group bacterium]|nr:oxidoreductase [Parcubacteria group bacterium]
MQPASIRERYLIPGAIVLAGIILAITIFVVRSHQEAVSAGDPTAVRPVTPSDHLIGNPQAAVTIVEYGDIDSSYSKQLQTTLEQLMSEYASGGQVAWVYRHFPLADMHPNSLSHAEAAECAASLGAPDAFWRFIDLVQAQAPAENQFDPKDYPTVVTQLGISVDTFNTCLSSHQFSKHVTDDAINALNAGADGSPYVVLLVKGQKPSTISGTIPYQSLKRIIDQAVSKAGQ